MRKLFFITGIVSVFLLLCSCNGNYLPLNKNDDLSSVTNVSSQSGTTAISEKGFRLVYDSEQFDYTAGEKDVFASKTTGSFLEIYLSGGKTVDDYADEYIGSVKSNGFTVSDPKSVAVGREFYSAKYFTAEKEGEKQECYFIPVQNECLAMIFDIKGDDEAELISMLDNLTID